MSTSSNFDSFMKKVVKEVRKKGQADRSARKIFNEAGYMRRGKNSNKVVAAKIAAFGLSVDSFGDPNDESLDFPVTFRSIESRCRDGRTFLGKKKNAVLDSFIEQLIFIGPELYPLQSNNIKKEATARFRDSMFAHLPVVDSATNKFIGVV